MVVLIEEQILFSTRFLSKLRLHRGTPKKVALVLYVLASNSGLSRVKAENVVLACVARHSDRLMFKSQLNSIFARQNTCSD
jgi:hypothetical protein